MSGILRPIKWFYHEFGIDAVHHVGRNAYLLIVARACRMFAFGTNSLILGEQILMKQEPSTYISCSQLSSSLLWVSQTTASASS